MSSSLLDRFGQCLLAPVTQHSHFWVHMHPRACARLFAAVPVPVTQTGNCPQDRESQKGDIVVMRCWDNEHW